MQLGICNRRGDRDGDRLGDLVLHREDIGEITVVPLGPHVLAGFGLDQLRRDTNAIAGFAQTPLEYVTHAQFAADPLHINRAALVCEGGMAGDHEKREG